MNWSTPYFGITHRGEGKSRLTITDRGDFAELDRWFPGCGLSPLQSDHASVADAKVVGDAWLKDDK